MRAFDYTSPETVEEVLALLAAALVNLAHPARAVSQQQSANASPLVQLTKLVPPFGRANDKSAESAAMSGDTVRTARIVLGAVAPIPWRTPGAERVLAGKAVTDAVAAEAATAALAGAKALSGNAYKIQIARTAVKRAVLAAAGLA